MSESTREIFKNQLQYKRQISKRNIRIKKSSTWLIPTAYVRQYKKLINEILNQYINITESIYPILENWINEVKQIKDNIKDQWSNELDRINEEEYNKIFEKEKSYLKEKLLGMATLISVFNRKQWEKIVKQSLGIDHFMYEKWESTILETWVNRNVSLIKGLTDEYRKKITDTIISEVNRGASVNSLKQQLITINKEFANGKPTTILKLKDGTRLVYKNEDIRKSLKIQEKIKTLQKDGKIEIQTCGYTQSRAELIAKDQINKINGELSAQRQNDAGVNIYQWASSNDERVRASHQVMNGKYCTWQDPTLYADTKEDALAGNWKSRSSIGGVQLHVSEDVNCRCIPLPVFDDIVNEVNNE